MTGYRSKTGQKDPPLGSENLGNQYGRHSLHYVGDYYG